MHYLPWESRLVLFLNTATVITAATWLGAIVFHGVEVVPTAFKSADGMQTAQLLRALLHRYYRLGLVVVIAVVSANNPSIGARVV